MCARSAGRSMVTPSTRRDKGHPYVLALDILQPSRCAVVALPRATRDQSRCPAVSNHVDRGVR